MKKRFNYFYGDQAQLFAFYRTPKTFFQSDEYKDLSAEAKILYGILLDRVSLSAIGRALGEAMAINMVAGGAVNIPLPFNSVRTLTTQIVSEMGYASGIHRQVLFTVGLVLYAFIMIVNFLLLKARKRGVSDGD